MMKKYFGGYNKVSLIVSEYNSFEYPSKEFIPVKFPLYKIGYDKLGKRHQKVTRCLKMRNKILLELGVLPTIVKDLPLTAS
jgi:hypothetical protein